MSHDRDLKKKNTYINPFFAQDSDYGCGRLHTLSDSIEMLVYFAESFLFSFSL